MLDKFKASAMFEKYLDYISSILSNKDEKYNILLYKKIFEILNCTEEYVNTISNDEEKLESYFEIINISKQVDAIAILLTDIKSYDADVRFKLYGIAFSGDYSPNVMKKIQKEFTDFIGKNNDKTAILNKLDELSSTQE